MTGKLREKQIGALAHALKTLGEPNRLSILLKLTRKCHSVSFITKATGLSQTNVSFHLRKLRETGLVKMEPRGRFKYY